MNAVNRAVGSCVVAEADKDLIDHDVVEHLVAGGAEAGGEAEGVVATTIDEIGDAGAAEGAEGGPGVDGAVRWDDCGVWFSGSSSPCGR